MKDAFQGLLVVSLTLIMGCAMQSEIIQSRHWDLNETIRKTSNEQLLLNLVRLRYSDTLYFLQLSSITTNFSANANLGTSGSFPAGGNSVLGLSGGISYSESPTVTWSIPDSREFLGRLYAPIGADQLTVLSQTGFDLVDVLRIGVQQMNLLRNWEFQIRDGEYQPESYPAFLEALNLMEALRKEGLIDFTYGLMSNYGGPPLPLSQIDARGIADGTPSILYLSRSPGMASPYRVSKPLLIRFRKESDLDPRAKRLRQLLKLRPELYQYPITNNSDIAPEGIAAIDGKLPLVFDPDLTVTHIGLNNRSVYDILRFAAASVDVTESALANGQVRKSDIRLDEYLDIRSSSSEPSNAWLKVKYQGDWYFIQANDIHSKTTFALLSALFASVVGEVPGAKPVLTLPIN